MKGFLFILSIVFLASCKKESWRDVKPLMTYKNLENNEASTQQELQLDLDGNGTVDVRFKTYLIGDPLMKLSKIQFCAQSMIESNFPVDPSDNAPVFNAGDTIKTNNTNAYEWFRVSQVVLAQKNIPDNGSNNFWTGNWKEAEKKFLPIQLLKNGKRYNGWIELTVDTANEKVIVHRSGISNKAAVNITAGK